MTLLSARHLTKKYDAVPSLSPALSDVSLDLYRGEVVSLLGVNGAGKTTLSMIIAGLARPTSGDIEWNGASIYLDPLSYRRRIGYCPQRSNLDPFLTVSENLVFAGRYFGLDKASATAQAESFLVEYELEPFRNRKPEELSGGAAQRLLIARALMHTPALVILDEPTVGLDVDVRRQLWVHIKALRDKKITVLLTTHYLEEAEMLSDRVCILDKGKVLLTENLRSLQQRHDGQSLEKIFLSLTGRV